jgi:glucose-6-phosphate-specific signal transduction histidine kinase
MIVALAAGCMVVQDILAVLLVDAEARNRGWLAGILDSAVWLFAIATTTIAVTALQGHSLAGKVELVVFVTAANLIGMRLGVWIGKRYIHSDSDEQ